MAGHSQFKNIMHRKGRQDKARSKVFSKLAREITVAAKMGMPDPNFNPRLRAAIIAARGLSSAASAANAAIDHIRDWALGSHGEWVTMGVPSNGEYGIPKGIVFGFPVTTENGEYKIVEGLEIDAFSSPAHSHLG